MLNIMLEQNRSFEAFKDYFKHVQSSVLKLKNGKFMDPFENRVHSFKMDELGNLIGVALSEPKGTATMILWGNPDATFEVQADNYDKMYRMTYQAGRCVYRRESNLQSYTKTYYGPDSGENPIAQEVIHHAGPFEKKRWTADGKTLVYSKVRFMDKGGTETTMTEFLDSGHRCLRVDLYHNRQYCQTEMYSIGSDGKSKLQWLCVKDAKGNYCFYDNKCELVNVVTNKNGKRCRVPVEPRQSEKSR